MNECANASMTTAVCILVENIHVQLVYKTVTLGREPIF